METKNFLYFTLLSAVFFEWTEECVIRDGTVYTGTPKARIQAINTKEECRLKCSDDYDCVAWNHETNNKACLLFYEQPGGEEANSFQSSGQRCTKPSDPAVSPCQYKTGSIWGDGSGEDKKHFSHSTPEQCQQTCDGDGQCCAWIRDSNVCRLFYDGNVPSSKTVNIGAQSGSNCVRTDLSNCPQIRNPSVIAAATTTPPTTSTSTTTATTTSTTAGSATTGAAASPVNNCGSTSSRNTKQYTVERRTEAKGNIFSTVALAGDGKLLQCAALCSRTDGCVQWGFDESGGQANCHLFDTTAASVEESDDHTKGSLYC